MREDEERIVNYGGSETISLSSTSKAGDTLEKEDLSATSVVDPENRHIQNPVYDTSEFFGIGVSENRTYQNPVYDTVGPTITTTSDENDDIPEKVIPSPEDFLTPDTQPLVDTPPSTTKLPLVDTPPSVTTDTKPLIATTTVAQTTTMATGSDAKYESAGPVPMDIATEPLYATVLPKHNRATAKPFAADGDSDDD